MDPLEQAKRLFFEALSCQQKGDLGTAERLYEEALGLAPDRPSIMNNLAVVYIRREKHWQARQLCERCLDIDPLDREAKVNLGICLVELNAPADALVVFDAVLAREPDDPVMLAHRAAALLRLGRVDDAVAACERAVAIEAHCPQAWNMLGNALLKRNETEQALVSYRRALSAQPDHAESLFNLAATLLREGRADEANTAFQRAIALRPDDAKRRLSYADALRMQHRLSEAAEQYRRALQLHPGDADAAYGLGCAHLLLQDYRAGWEGYEHRIQTKEYRQGGFRRAAESIRRFDAQPRWQGPGFAAAEVAIWAEQGIGDEVLSSTLIPELIESGTRFVYELDARLIPAYRRAYPLASFVARTDPPDARVLNADRVIAAGSLPRLFRSSLADFTRQPRAVIRALPERTAHYRRELGQAGRIKVALSWHSARDHWWARKKNVPLSVLSPLLQTPAALFVDVQYGNTDEERRAAEAACSVAIRRFDAVDHFNDLEELLAILDACDLVITTSNATAHFAGALGKPTWVLFPGDRPPFHYWAHRGDYRSAWYPSVEMVTRPELDDWPSLVRYAADKLARSI